MIYYPDNWVILKIRNDAEGYTIHKVLGGWSGGYAQGSSWRLSSGITGVERKDNGDLLFKNESGSIYHCAPWGYRLKMNNAHIYERLLEKFGDAIELLPENTDFTNYDWGR